MKNIKNLISVVLMLILVGGLVGCSTQSPSDVVENCLENIKKGQMEEIDNLLSENTNEADKSEELSDEVDTKLMNSIKKITYKVNSEQVDGDSATVNVTVNGPDIATVIGKYMQEAFSMVFSQSFSGQSLTEEKEQEMYNEVLSKYLDEVSYTDRTQDIKLVKKDGQWEITEKNTLATLVLNIDPSLFDETSENNNKEIATMVMNEPFTVKTEDGDYILTIEGARETTERNEFSEKEVTKVVILDYTYQNISFGQESGEDLYIDEYSFQVLDDEGNVLDTYPVYDENRVAKNTPIGGKCKSSATFAVTTDSKNLNVTFTSGLYEKVANILVPIN